MAKRPTLTDLTSLTNSSGVNAINTNWDAIQEAFDNTLSRDGSTPNAMNADLDLNGNALLNVGTIDADNLTLDGQTITDVSAVPEWRGAWLTATSYAKRDMVKQSGNVYICLIAHTSGTFSTDLTALRWELMVTKGDSGVGSGDLVSTNNLSDVSNVTTARANLGLGTVAVESTVPVAKGGTGATDAATARTALGAQAQDAFLDQIAALTDPGADRVMFWDDSAGTITFLELGTGLTITGTTITASGGLGVNQTWQNMTASRAFGTSYQNTTGAPISVIVRATNIAGATVTGDVSLDNSSWTVVDKYSHNVGSTFTDHHQVAWIVPPGQYYRCVFVSGNATLITWMELRS